MPSRYLRAAAIVIAAFLVVAPAKPVRAQEPMPRLPPDPPPTPTITPIEVPKDPVPPTPAPTPIPTVSPLPPAPTVPPIRNTPTPPPTPTIPPTSPPPTVPPVSPPPAPTIPPVLPTPPPVNSEESIPVVIDYGQGHQTRASINRGVMEPVGVPKAQSVTVTLFLPSTYAGQIVSLGLYDGGEVGGAAAPGSAMVAFQAIAVPADGVVQFNFKAGHILGLYRVLITIGPAQYLLQFYAVTPRPTSGLPPLPSATVSPHGTPNPPPPG